MNEAISNVRLERVTKIFDGVRALANVSFEINSGEIVAVMGKNGAGKSTLMSILSLSMRPSRGDILLNNKKAHDMTPKIYGKIGLLSHLPLVYPDLTCKENLTFLARLHRVNEPEQVIASLVREFEMNSFAEHRPCRVLSRGQLQRVALARSLISKPDLLLLDEPAAGLDRGASLRIDRVLKSLIERGSMAVVVTHEPEVAARVATRAIMIKNGELASDTEAPPDTEGWRTLYDSSVEGSKS